MKRARLNEGTQAILLRNPGRLAPLRFLPMVELEEVTTGRRSAAYIGYVPYRDRLMALAAAARSRRLLALWVLDAPAVTVDACDVFSVAS